MNFFRSRQFLNLKYATIAFVILNSIVFSAYFSLESKPGTNDTMVVKIGKASLRVEIADTPQRRSTGLMFRTKLARNEGMLFVFPNEDYLSFWMKNTKIPLSIGYFDQDGILLEIHNMKPNQTTEVYNARSKAIYALEVNQGWFKENGVSIGSVLILEKSVVGR
ncbi:DUF192 domain-containing protein [Leptospira sp. GIMC2001]|uniref:DUF192 domain-containing protein n=1 Tax=Leptospira sp. GIMC2001 TaxID=1513297 RepID=UPI00234B6BF5|nr:DUF192 domain-containing protein [Leptospira sp. GIMC2001]WCL50267.1 DUF192 domain-containing protein [Leptospira sp. GIMC2001]